jgi:hypothetical protein
MPSSGRNAQRRPAYPENYSSAYPAGSHYLGKIARDGFRHLLVDQVDRESN